MQQQVSLVYFRSFRATAEALHFQVVCSMNRSSISSAIIAVISCLRRSYEDHYFNKNLLYWSVAERVHHVFSRLLLLTILEYLLLALSQRTVGVILNQSV